MKTKQITEEEWELLQCLRNYRRAYPNGAKMLKAEIFDLVYELMDINYQEEENQKFED